MENTFFDVYDIKHLVACAKKNNVEITITWYEDHGFITIHPILEIEDCFTGEPEQSETRKLEEVIANCYASYANSKTDDEPKPPEEHKHKDDIRDHNTDNRLQVERIRLLLGALFFKSADEIKAIMKKMDDIYDKSKHVKISDLLKFANKWRPEDEKIVGDSIFDPCSNKKFIACDITRPTSSPNIYSIVVDSLPRIIYMPHYDTDDEATMKRIVSEICSIEFDHEVQAFSGLSSMHYLLHANGSVTSDYLFDLLDSEMVNFDFKEDDSDDNVYIGWEVEECGDEFGDFLNVKIIKKANGKYSYDSSNFPKPSYCAYSY